MESPSETDTVNYHTSAIYKAIEELSPDVLIVDLLWVPVRCFLDRIPCKKIFLTRQVRSDFYSFTDSLHSFLFNPDLYDHVLAIEPFECSITSDHINPIILRNSDEIMSRDEAHDKLRLDSGRKYCLLSLNASEKASRAALDRYSRLKKEGYDFFVSSLFTNGIFPIVDYFNAFDLIICGGGYNAFWETIFFHKEVFFIPMQTLFESQTWRIEHCRDYQFTKNGADELVEIITGM